MAGPAGAMHVLEVVHDGAAHSVSATCHVFHCRVVATGRIPPGSFLVLEYCHQACASDGACMHVSPVAVPLRPDDTSVSLPVYGDAGAGARNAVHLLWGVLAGDRGARACRVVSDAHVAPGHAFAMGPFSVGVMRIEDVPPRDASALAAACHANQWHLAEDVLDDDDDATGGDGAASHPHAGDHPCAWYHLRALPERLPPLFVAAPDRGLFDRACGHVDALVAKGGLDGFGALVHAFARAAVRASRIVLGAVYVSLDDACEDVFVHPTRLCLPLTDGTETEPYLARALVLRLIHMRLAALRHAHACAVELVQSKEEEGGRAFLVFHAATPVHIDALRERGVRLPVCVIEVNTRAPMDPLALDGAAKTGIPHLDAELGHQRDLLASNTRR